MRVNERRQRRWLFCSSLICGSACSVWVLVRWRQCPRTVFLPCPSKTIGMKSALESRTFEATEPQWFSWASSRVAAAVVAGSTGAHATVLNESSADSGLAPLIPIAIGSLIVAIFKLLKEPTLDPVDDKAVVSKYFNGEGFERWNNIYGDTEDVNPVQMDIRVGHAETVEKVLGWLDGAVQGKTVCDAGCGTGNLSLPLASQGASVSASDISSAMVSEARRRAEKSLPESQRPNFETSDLEALSGSYDVVCCIDVLIHYPPERLEAMIGHLAGLSRGRLLLSFAPKTWYYVGLKNIGELFPGKSKTTRAYLHAEETVESVLNRLGYQVTRKEMTATKFYFSRLFEAVPTAA